MILALVSFTVAYMIYFLLNMYSKKKIVNENFSASKTNSEKSFTNTDKWGDSEYNLIHEITPLGKSLLKNIPKIQFPNNDSITTQLELEAIKSKISRVDELHRMQIKDEVYLDTMLDRFDITNQEKRSIESIMRTEIDPIIMNMKQQYNRTRPYRLNDNIIPIIEPPKHPSYPSGHAVQSFFSAFLLGEKYPNKRDHYIRVAERLSVNREYAGVHYESDTKYGRQIAETLFKHFSGTHNPLM
jgi:hypothetical protein